MSDVYNRDPENDLTYNSGTGSYVLTSSLLNPDPIDESTTVKELAVNSTVYDIVGKGILDQNSKTTQIEWVGTKAEYDALGVYADHCTYIITDDDSEGTNVYTKAEVDSLVTSAVSQANAHRVIEFQIPTASNGYTWYRKYADGWVEQGGITATTSGNFAPVTYPVVMSDDNYTLNVSAQTPRLTSASTIHGCHYVVKETTRCTIICLAGNSGTWIAGNISWQVSGMSAQ